MMQHSIAIHDPEHNYSIQIPSVTPAGQTVQVDKDERAGMRRVHAHSPDFSELYFEIVSYPGLIDHEQAIAEQKASLSYRAPDANISGTQHSTICGLAAKAFRFEGTLGGQSKIRRFVFVDAPTRTYRIVYDPTSDLNERVLDSLVLGEQA